jgi:hypothetical protein
MKGRGMRIAVHESAALRLTDIVPEGKMLPILGDHIPRFVTHEWNYMGLYPPSGRDNLPDSEEPTTLSKKVRTMRNVAQKDDGVQRLYADTLDALERMAVQVYASQRVGAKERLEEDVRNFLEQQERYQKKHPREST